MHTLLNTLCNDTGQQQENIVLIFYVVLHYVPLMHGNYACKYYFMVILQSATSQKEPPTSHIP